MESSLLHHLTASNKQNGRQIMRTNQIFELNIWFAEIFASTCLLVLPCDCIYLVFPIFKI